MIEQEKSVFASILEGTILCSFTRSKKTHEKRTQISKIKQKYKIPKILIGIKKKHTKSPKTSCLKLKKELL
jgi:hypothetical protein